MENNRILFEVTEIIHEVGVPDTVENLTVDTDLIESGILDSLGKVELIDAIWERYRLEISPAELFTTGVTIQSVTDIVEKYTYQKRD